jgi:succinate dehydrogenase / fumarate reductase cytochrome b subunit
MDFYIKAKFLGEAPVVIVNGKELHDLGLLVIQRFQIGWVVGVYIVALLGLAFHLHHGFQSAFQTIGFNHEVYTPVIKVIGLLYSIIIPAGFIFIALYTYYHF